MLGEVLPALLDANMKNVSWLHDRIFLLNIVMSQEFTIQIDYCNDQDDDMRRTD